MILLKSVKKERKKKGMLTGKRDVGPLKENIHHYDALYVTFFGVR